MSARWLAPDELTAQQLQVLRLAANGLTSQQIAARIGRSTDAVHIRMKHACASLGAKSRTHAVAIALVRGLIAPHEITTIRLEPKETAA